MKSEEIKEMLMYYYEIDLDNCTMNTDNWINELSKAMSDPEYTNKFIAEYKEYKEQRD